MRLSLTPALLSLPLTLGLANPALADEAVLDFGVPAWPGITVKTEIAQQLLAPLGYETRTHELGLQVVYQGLETGDIDAFLGGWMPAQANMYTPREASGAVVKVANNVDGARMTLVVPDYLYAQGIRSFADLDDHRELFDGEIHGFGAGSAASEVLHEAIDDDTWGLGDWQVMDTSVVGMLGAARSAIDREEPIVWVGWTPHWMNLELPMRYLDDPKDLFGENNGETDVLTVLRSDYADAHPGLVGFFEQFTFAAEEQSWMINEFGQKKRDAEAVARQWLHEHPERVEAMLEGVTTLDGKPAWPAVEASL
ncbi:MULTISPECIES: ABC transporter substrate-binding protein [unclassified Halomonas]|uniref:ABC transporter substrate-binding protein n=1 Tax=unclassified Halomonas TaxID=2609666 RepID=UPI00288363E9|nr:MULTISPECIES: ABC transporter substrate-binding protein [unclassified Halomonas]MDT0501372.1 ABC transporter substrate-binding protein [Halomonas sp. PAR7]MDT0512954.1 ABC transporter substrate-binding protein [Halomonas sp. LES1]MDT0591221.1 ABC transporter substrate-binding protein [Halomonas sp. PAR8]